MACNTYFCKYKHFCVNYHRYLTNPKIMARKIEFNDNREPILTFWERKNRAFIGWFIGWSKWHTNFYKKHNIEQPKDNNLIFERSGYARKNEINEKLNQEKGVYIGGGLHYTGDGHMLTVGGSGAGKGVNFIIPALLSPALVASGSSVVVLDPKGENLAICGEHLKRNGYKVLAINPFNIPEISSFVKAGFNPFSLTSKNDIEAPKFCDLIAECLIPDDGKNDHWNENDIPNQILHNVTTCLMSTGVCSLRYARCRTFSQMRWFKEVYCGFLT